VDRAAALDRRLANYRAAAWALTDEAVRPRGPIPDLAERMAAALDGEVVRTDRGTVVRCEGPSRPVPVDRERLARLPGQPPADAPLVCLDTETTGLATAAGTVAFLIGLGWWEGERLRQVQLLLPDHADEPAQLQLLADLIPPAAWLVTYNGRGFDWPLLVARFRMARRSAPVHAGHLDLLPLVRRLFRHRMLDARLRTAESTLLGVNRVGDVDGWQIPGRYLDFLRGGPADPLLEVVRHNDQDVRSLGHLLGLVERGFADPTARAAAPRGDLAGLARAFARERRLDEALDCLDAAIAAPPSPPPPVRDVPVPAEPPYASGSARPAAAMADVARREPIRVREATEDWMHPAYRPDFGGRHSSPRALPGLDRPIAFAAPWTEERLHLDRAHVLRRLGRIEQACEAWVALAASPGRVGVLAAIELAKLREHRLADPAGALEATTRGLVAAERRRRIGRPEPLLEANLQRRLARLRRRLDGRDRIAARDPAPRVVRRPGFVPAASARTG
jgi:hypothetical protein